MARDPIDRDEEVRLMVGLVEKTKDANVGMIGVGGFDDIEFYCNNTFLVTHIWSILRINVTPTGKNATALM